MLPRGAAVADRYARLSPREARQFVADLYAARGWETSIEGEAVIARRDGVERRLEPVSSSRQPRATPDDVVVLDPSAVAEMVRYALDDETRTTLLATHFGGSGGVWRRFEPSDDGAAARRWVRFPLPERVVVGALALLLVAVVLATAGGHLGTGLSVPRQSSAGPAVATTDASGTLTPPEAGRPGLPPGLSPAGITNRDLLVRTHGMILDNTSYTWTLTYRVFDGFETRGFYRGTVRVANERVYAVTTERRGLGFEGDGAPTVGEQVYADGDREWYDENGTRCMRPVRGADRYTARAERYVSSLLQANRSLVVNRSLGGRWARYTVELYGGPMAPTRHASGRLEVGERGRIFYLRRAVEGPFGDLIAVVTLRFSDIGETTVAPPAWVERSEVVPSGCYSSGST